MIPATSPVPARWCRTGLLGLSALLALSARAEMPSSMPAAVDTSTPRGTLARFLQLTRNGRDTEAATFLDPAAPADLRTAEVARQLGAVLEVDPVFRMERASALPAGDLADDLDPALDHVGELGERHGRARITLRHTGHGGNASWVFWSGTLLGVEGWYASLDDRWARDHLPAVLVRPGPRHLAYWQWLALPLLLLAGYLLGRALAWALLRVLRALAARSDATWDDELVVRLRGPVVLLASVLSVMVLLPTLTLQESAETLLMGVLTHAGVPLALAWGTLRSVDVLAASLDRSPWLVPRPEARALLPLGRKVLKVTLVVGVVMAILQALGYPVTSIVAGLGLGGLVVALAAQKTLENLFGSIALSVDQPFHPGHFVKVGEVVGTVENVGLRSTRIRTLDRTLVTIPNGKLADMQVENYSPRDRFRLNCVVGIVYATPPETVRVVVAEMEKVLLAHPALWRESYMVRVRALAAYSIDIEVMAWFQVPTWADFTPIREDMQLQFMEAVKRCGSDLAFPTQTVHLAPPAPAP
jgi:MscS family membrane protein